MQEESIPLARSTQSTNGSILTVFRPSTVLVAENGSSGTVISISDSKTKMSKARENRKELSRAIDVIQEENR